MYRSFLPAGEDGGEVGVDDHVQPLVAHQLLPHRRYEERVADLREATLPQQVLDYSRPFNI